MEYTKNQISTLLIKEISKQVHRYNYNTDKVDIIISDAIDKTSKKLDLKPSDIILTFGISNIRKMLPINFYNKTMEVVNI